MDRNNGTRVVREAIIRNAQGIHCRPTALIVKKARSFPQRIVIKTAQGGEANPHSAIELLSLGLECGAKVQIHVEGDQASHCASVMADLFETNFDFSPDGEA